MSPEVVERGTGSGSFRQTRVQIAGRSGRLYERTLRLDSTVKNPDRVEAQFIKESKQLLKKWETRGLLV